jgi:hypothetical protein
MAAGIKSLSMKNILGRALRETGAAMKEAGRSEVRRCVYMSWQLLIRSIVRGDSNVIVALFIME